MVPSGTVQRDQGYPQSSSFAPPGASSVAETCEVPESFMPEKFTKRDTRETGVLQTTSGGEVGPPAPGAIQSRDTPSSGDAPFEIDDQPEQSELAEEATPAAGKKPKRPRKFCHPCLERKSRCRGGQPCAQCRSKVTLCIYDEGSPFQAMQHAAQAAPKQEGPSPVRQFPHQWPRRVCQSCHDRKTKCNMRQPCSLCQHYGFSCEYSERR